MSDSMEENLTAIASFRKSYPISFSLYDDDDQNVIYIDDKPTDRIVRLEIVNSSQQNVELENLSGNASKDNYHFELKFRPGTLSTASLQKIDLTEESTSNWSLAKSLPSTNGHPVSLYLLLKTTDKTLASNGKIDLTLQNVGADISGGSRGTRVELKYHKLKYQNDSIEISGSRVEHLSIVNHRGKKNIPLHAGFVASNTVLNDGNSESDLTLRITNVSKDKAISLNPKGSKAPSEFIISFEYETKETGPWDKPWAVGTINDLGKVALSEPKDWEKTPESGQGESHEWIFTPQDNKTSLMAGETIQIQIKGVKSLLPSGQANLYVRYKNIPGYWDGELVCSIEKAPLLYCEQNVGIGTTSPASKLDVNGEMRASIYYDKDDTSFFLAPKSTSKVKRIDISAGDNNNAINARNNGNGYTTINVTNEGDGCAIHANNKGSSFAAISAENHGSYYDFYSHGNQHYGSASSIKLKENVYPIKEALDKILNIQGVYFTWKESGKNDLGFIAEEVGKQIPEAVTYGEDGYAVGMSYDHVIPVLVEAVKEQQKMIQNLIEIINELKRY